MKSGDRVHSDLATPNMLRCGRFNLPLHEPLIMGVVNITPDSFSDGGRFLGAKSAVEHAQRLIEEGAHIIDLGAESSRPGATPVALDEELRRLMPVLDGLCDVTVPISVDTTKNEVMRRAIAAGASMVNDISALASPDVLAVVAASDVAVCLMHMQGEPRNMQILPTYRDVVAEVRQWLKARIDLALQAGIARERIVIDPGFGFGKTTDHNLELLRNLRHFAALGYPVLVGLSRKSLLGKIVSRSNEQRTAASVAAAVIAVEKGARLVRVHDVAETRDALRVWAAVADPEFQLP